VHHIVEKGATKVQDKIIAQNLVPYVVLHSAKQVEGVIDCQTMQPDNKEVYMSTNSEVEPVPGANDQFAQDGVTRRVKDVVLGQMPEIALRSSSSSLSKRRRSSQYGQHVKRRSSMAGSFRKSTTNLYSPEGNNRDSLKKLVAGLGTMQKQLSTHAATLPKSSSGIFLDYEKFDKLTAGRKKSMDRSSKGSKTFYYGERRKTIANI